MFALGICQPYFLELVRSKDYDTKRGKKWALTFQMPRDII